MPDECDDEIEIDDVSGNGAIDGDPFENDGEPWDPDRGYPEELEDDEESDDE